MKMSKLFTTVFDEEMKSRGYKRKAKLYYRLNGEILQGVIIKTTNPYDIHFYSAPYWMENIQADLSSFSKGYWAEKGFCICPGSKAYYREENETLNKDYMDMCFILAKQYVLPILDKMNNVDSYIEYCIPNWSSLDTYTINERLNKIDTDRIGEKYSYINSRITMLWDIWDGVSSYLAFLNYGCSCNDLQAGYDLLEEKTSGLPPYENYGRRAQNDYLKFMTSDGITRAKEYFAKRRSIVLPRLRDELGLSCFDL